MNATGSALLETAQLSKVYGGTVALHPAGFRVHAGTVHGLLGKNGAGKSTLLGLLAGSVEPSGGRVVFDGRDVTGDSLAQRRASGIRLLDQHAQVVPQLSITENLLMPNLPRRRGFVDWATAHDQARRELEGVGMSVDPRTAAGSLGTADQRKLNIIKALSGNAKLIMLDEPTTALTHAERSALFDWIRNLRDEGRTFVFISHYTQEVRELCDVATVLRDGSIVSEGEEPGQLSASELSRRITGTEVAEYRHRSECGGPKFEVRELRPAGCGAIDFTVAEKEIVGVMGLAGSGAGEAVRALVGLHPHTVGSARLDGREVDTSSVRGAAASGVSYLPGDRLDEGIVPMLSLLENTYLGQWPRRGPLIDRAAMRAGFGAYAERLALRARAPEQPVRELSGGNQQKILLSRLLERDPDVLVLHEPTLGVDVQTKEQVHRLIGELADAGNAVLLHAYDTEEIAALCDRVLIFRHGAVATELRDDQVTVDAIHAALEADE